MPYYRQLSPVPSTATVSQSYTKGPIVGPVLEIGKPRVLIGWTHQNDTPRAQWKVNSSHACLSFGAQDTRSCLYSTLAEIAARIRGSRILWRGQFHDDSYVPPYWANAGPNGALPRDMAWRPKHEDKARLRRLYHEFIRDYYPVQADGLPQFPAPELLAEELNDDQSIFIDDQEDAMIAKSAPAKPAKKSRKPRNPRAPKSSTQRPPRCPEETATAYPSPLGIGTNEMSKKEYRRLAAENDRGSVKSETSRATSLFAAREPAMSPPTLSPGHNIANLIDPIDFDELATAMNEQARAYPSITPEEAFQDPINLVDDYDQHLEDERLLAEWNVRVGLGAQGPASGSTRSANNEEPASPTISNGRVAQSIEQDA